MKLFKNGTIIFIIGLIGLAAVISFELYHAYSDEAHGCTPQEIAAMDIQPVNINTAASEDLSALSELTDKQIQSILAYRAAHGAFSSIEEIMQVEGVGKKTYEKIALYLSVE